MTTITLPAGGWRPRPYQMDAWKYLEQGGKRLVLVQHRRAGKDEVALNWTAIAAVQRPGTYWYLLPEISQGRKAIWNAVNEDTGIRRIDQAFPEELRARTNDHEMFIEFKSGSTFQVVGSDSYNSLVGSPPVGVVLSEWALANPAAWAYLSPVLERNGGWAIFPYTPRGKNHGYAFWKASQESEGWFGVKQTALETGVFTTDQLARIKTDLIRLYGDEDGENLFNQEYLCSFDAAIMGSYYGRIVARLEQQGRITAVPYDPNYPVITGWDLGLDDATAIWFAQIVGREVRVFDYLECRNRELTAIARDVLAKGYAYADHYLPHDVEVREITSAKTRRETLELLGLKPIRPGKQRDAGERINSVRNFLPLCVFDAKRCERGLEALKSYCVDYDEKNATPRKNPKHNWASHPADAFGEIAMQINLVGTQRQNVVLSDYDVFSASLPGYAAQMNRNPVPNTGWRADNRPEPVTSWDPMEADYR
jgi:hypothetical protein